VISRIFEALKAGLLTASKGIVSFITGRTVEELEVEEPAFKEQWAVKVKVIREQFRVLAEIEHPKPVAVLVKNYGRPPMYREAGFPIKLTEEEARETLERLRHERERWIDDWMRKNPGKWTREELRRMVFVPLYGGRRSYNPLSPAAEEKLVKEGIVIRKRVKAIQPTYFIERAVERIVPRLVRDIAREELSKAIRKALVGRIEI